MKSSFTSLGEMIISKYPENQFTEFQIDTMVDNLVQFFTIGAKIAYKNKKMQKNQNNSVQIKINNI